LVATAQILRPGNDPRNQAPTVGTGGQPGGPTGLFTIYDGDTLRKGEYTNTFFRPTFNQTFVRFPFVGGLGPDFGLTGYGKASRTGVVSAGVDSIGGVLYEGTISTPC
jgi:hypothetical protein